VGVFLAWLYQLRGTLLVPILAHAVFNGLGVALIRAGLG
jgi:membrane protease YdiL (CAAX protease family)